MFESIAGFADGSHEEMRTALRKALRQLAMQHVPLEDGNPAGVAIESTFKDAVIFKVYGESPSGLTESPFLKVNVGFKESKGAFTFNFSNLRTVKKSITFDSEAPLDAKLDAKVSVATEANEEDWEDEAKIDGVEDTEVSVATEDEELAMTESVSANEDGHAFELYGRIMLEGTPDEARKRFEKTGVVKGKVPIINIGEFTANGNRYTAKAAAHLERDISRLQVIRSKSQLLEISGAPWPTGAMYPSHMPAKGAEGPERFLSIVSRITGTKRENRNGSQFFFVTFETLKTTAGTDMAILLLETPEFIPGVSLRGIAKEEVANERSGFDVDRLQLAGFGVDFTNNPAMPGVKEIGIQLEDAPPNETGAVVVLEGITLDPVKALMEQLAKSDKPEDKQMLEALKLKFEEGATSATALAEANEELETRRIESAEARKVTAKGVAQKVAQKWEEKLKEEKSFSDSTVAQLMETAKPAIERASIALLESREDLDVTSERFEDALWSGVEPVLAGARNDLKTLLTAELQARNLGDAPILEDQQHADEGNNGLHSEKNVNANTMDARHIRMEEDNERTGYGTGRKLPNGETNVVPLKDAILSAAWGVPVYEENAAGNPVHIMQKYFPHKAAAARVANRNYRNEAFIMRDGSTSWTDALLEQSPLWENVIQPLERREKLEASALTSAGVLGTLIPSVRQGIVESAFALSKWLEVATLNPIETPDYEIWEEDYERQDLVIQSTLTWTAGTMADVDGTAGTIPGRLFAKVTTVMVGGTGIVIATFTNQNGDSVTASVAIPTTAAVGAMIEVRAGYQAGTDAITSRVGDRFVDVTGVAEDTGDAATTGEVELVHWKDLNTGSETTVSGGSQVGLTKISSTVEEFDLSFELSWKLIEDSLKALAATGPGRYDAPSALTRAVSRDFANAIDQRGFYAMNQSANYDASNDLTFDVGTPPTPAFDNALPTPALAWAAYLHNYLVRVNTGIKDWAHESPDKMVMNHTDMEMLLWIKGDMITRFERRAEEFFQSLAWGTVAGMQTFDAAYAHKRVMFEVVSGRIVHNSYIPLEFRGPFSFVDRNKTNIWVARSRTKDHFTKNKTRGRLLVTGVDPV